MRDVLNQHDHALFVRVNLLGVADDDLAVIDPRDAIERVTDDLRDVVNVRACRRANIADECLTLVRFRSRLRDREIRTDVDLIRAVASPSFRIVLDGVHRTKLDKRLVIRRCLRRVRPGMTAPARKAGTTL